VPFVTAQLPPQPSHKILWLLLWAYATPVLMSWIFRFAFSSLIFLSQLRCVYYRLWLSATHILFRPFLFTAMQQ
jgi:hypothetical protein